MQLGTRWAVGAEAPSRLPDAVVAAIRQVESGLIASSAVNPASRSWTLTWLEGLPVVALDQLNGESEATVIRYQRDADSASITAGSPDDEWPDE